MRTLNPAPGAPRPELIATPAPPTERSQAPQIPCKARLRPANHATTKAVLDGCSADGATRAQSLISPPETAQAPDFEAGTGRGQQIWGVRRWLPLVAARSCPDIEIYGGARGWAFGPLLLDHDGLELAA